MASRKRQRDEEKEDDEDDEDQCRIDSCGNRSWHGPEGNTHHRDHDRPALVFSGGTRFFYQHGQLHRDHDRPAMMHSSGERVWCQHNQYNRISGPARTWPDGRAHYYINDKRVSSIRIACIRNAGQRWLNLWMRRNKERREIARVCLMQKTCIPISVIDHCILSFLSRVQ